MNDASESPENKDRPRTRFQQPGGLPPVASLRGVRAASADMDTESTGDDQITAKPQAVARSSESDAKPAPASEPPRPFPPEVALYAAYPQALTDRLRAVYDQAALSAPLPTRWDLGVKLTIADADLWDQVQTVTADSLRDLVPLTVRVSAVDPTVQDRQEYAVGWTIAPGSLDELRRVRASVIAAIQAIVPDLMLKSLDPAIPAAHSIPALAFPTMIATMQHDFAPFSWSIESFAFAPLNAEAD